MPAKKPIQLGGKVPLKLIALELKLVFEVGDQRDKEGATGLASYVSFRGPRELTQRQTIWGLKP